MNSKTGGVLVFVLCVAIALGTGCLDSIENGPGVNQTEAAIAIALNDSIVREEILVATGDYEIVDVRPEFYEQIGSGDEFSGTFTGVIFRCCNQRSLYHVIVDGANLTVVNRYWEWVKEPMPCNGTEPPLEFMTLDEVSATLTTECALAVPSTLPPGYDLSLVRIYGEPCPRREIRYMAGNDTLRLVQTCNRSPPYAFAITGKEKEDVTIRGARAEFVKGVEENQISWKDANSSYWLSGPVGKTELLAVASSVHSSAPAASPVPEFAQRHSLNVLRGVPYTINGSVRNPAITRVQVWVLDGGISTRYIPVMPDGTFQFTLGLDETLALPRDFSRAIVVHIPQPPDSFTLTWDESAGRAVATGEGIPASILSHLEDRTLYPTTRADYLEQGILKSGQGNAVETYFLNGVDAWITIDPIGPTPPGTLEVQGSSSLPDGTPLSISVATVMSHPTPKYYDWSHEMADGTAQVIPGTGGINRFSCVIDTSKLNTGRYFIGVESQDDSLQADAMGTVELIGPVVERQGNFIDWNSLDLPPLAVNASIEPELLEGEWKLVPPGTQVHHNEIPYGSIIDCAPDGICRVFDQSGVQFLAAYYSNEAKMTEVPNGARINSKRVGNVTFVELGGDVILVKIDEYTKKA